MKLRPLPPKRHQSRTALGGHLGAVVHPHELRRGAALVELGWLTRLGERSPHAQLIVVADDTRPELINRALGLGAVCFVGESIKPDDLARAILLVSNQAPIVIGRNPRPAADAAPAVAHAAERPGIEALTKREQEILELVADGPPTAKWRRCSG